MSKKTIAIITLIVTGLLVLLFIFLRAKKDIEEPKTDKDESVSSEETLSNSSIINKEFIPSEPPTEANDFTFNGKPVTEQPSTEAETTFVNPIAKEKIDIAINNIHVDNIHYLTDFFETGYNLNDNISKKSLRLGEIDNPFLINKKDKNDSIMVVIKNNEKGSCPYSDCQVNNIMCDFSKCKAKILVGNHDITSMSPQRMIENFDTPQTYIENDSSTYISYHAKNITFDFEFSNNKVVSLGINLR